ncbi:MAG: hypothetical protein IT330_15195, partial [Anaerolineae bacterium]|nr:hypothetical protein [Anaerolineae bacterium]
ADGVLVVPQEMVEEVLVRTEEREAKELRIRDDFRRGDPVWEVYPRHGRL